MDWRMTTHDRDHPSLQCAFEFTQFELDEDIRRACINSMPTDITSASSISIDSVLYLLLVLEIESAERLTTQARQKQRTSSLPSP